jgi:hypothetical protein
MRLPLAEIGKRGIAPIFDCRIDIGEVLLPVTNEDQFSALRVVRDERPVNWGTGVVIALGVIRFRHGVETTPVSRPGRRDSLRLLTMLLPHTRKFSGSKTRRIGAGFLVLALPLGACGGGGNDAETEPTVTAEDASVTTLAVEEPVSSSTTSASATAAPEPGAGSISALGNGNWDGGDFVALVDARMDEIALTFGQPATPSALAPLFALPGDFSYPAGDVLGVFHSFDLDQRSDEIDITEERIIGVDGDPSAAALDSLAAVVEADVDGRWRRVSSQRDSFTNDLYTAEALDGVSSKDRLVITGTEAPDPGESPLRFEFEAAPTEIPVPAWAAGLPILEGGTLSSVREGATTTPLIVMRNSKNSWQAEWSPTPASHTKTLRSVTSISGSTSPTAPGRARWVSAS